MELQDCAPRRDKTNSLSREENNFVRLYLCQKIVTNAARLYFDSKVPGHTLESFLKQHTSDLTNPLRVYRCTKDEEAKLFPGGQAVVASKDFDFSLLYKLIRNLLTSIPAPTCGWGSQPLRGHVNEADDIERIRHFRNFLAHNSEFEICDTDFSTHWTDLSQAIARLSKGGLSTDVELMRTKTFDKNEMEDMRNELKEMREKSTDIKQDLDKCKTDNAGNKENIAINRRDIDDNKKEIHNINTRHTSLNIQTKEALDDPEKKNYEVTDMKSYGHVLIGGIVEYTNHMLKIKERLMAVEDALKRTKEMKDIKDIRPTINNAINEICEIRTGHSKGLDHLCSGSFQIRPFAYRMATIFMSMLSGAWLRWSEGNAKYTKFTFRKTIVDDKTYFHIFSADYPKFYVKMGWFSWWVSCVEGNPEGCNDATWEIKCVEHKNDYCYVLCTKDSNDNYLSAGSSWRMHGRRGDINERRMFSIH